MEYVLALPRWADKEVYFRSYMMMHELYAFFSLIKQLIQGGICFGANLVSL